ncbi:UNVERIFIED_CONTAM: hypothetical protein GTU68_058279 [Idotea baltica]|nr:hypothetical protein [Idotea baltica]
MLRMHWEMLSLLSCPKWAIRLLQVVRRVWSNQ